MGNIFNNNRNNTKLRINHDEYWDFFIDKDRYYPYGNFDGKKLYDKCLIAYIDTDLFECVGDNWLYSTNSYQWESGVSSGYTLYNVGYTGVDNGLIQFRKDRISNEEFTKIYSESDFSFEQDDLRLKVHTISGNTMKYEYPLRIENNLARLNGGFYQGVFKTECDKYQILPSSVYQDVWDFEFVLKKEEFEKESEKTLNDTHPNNKGFFFYLGTRAENKWVYLYDSGLTSGDTIKFEDDYLDDGDMECDPDSMGRFSDTDWYDELDDHLVSMEINNFVDYVYYPWEMYETDEYDEYIDTESKPLIIDDKRFAKDLEDCCKPMKEISYITKISCCCASRCRKIEIPIEIPKQRGCACIDCIASFGLDYISDINTLEDEDYLYVAPELDISDFDFQTAKYGLSLKSSKRYKSIFSDNKFLLFHRCGTGYTIGNWVEDTIVEYRQLKNNFRGNLFLLMNRTCTGYTVATIDDLIEQYNAKYNLYEDIYNNALGFRITDNGEIGYRYASVDCEISGDNKIKIYEGYSKPNIITEGKWHVIHVKLFGGIKTMYLQFYVDGKLKYITAEMPLLNLRKLIEEDEKQELVPFNLSLGGGTQGLCDVIMPNYMKQYNTILPIEENFAGTFIGWLKIFRWYNCTMELMNIYNNFKFEINNLEKK